MAGHRVDERLIDGRYARVEEIGRGGFGIVWRARDTLLERDVAIKEVEFPPVLDEEEQAKLREKVLREARAAARLTHPGVVTVYDVVEEDGRPFIIMELVESPTLAQLVERDGPLADRAAAAIGEQVLDALATAHAHGIVHRDVKPANVMVSPTGRVQLGDFGIASIIDDPKVTSSGQLAGSPSYMAPEQAHNQPAGPATDLWGLAATLYFAVEGEPPFEKEGAIPTLTSVVNDDPRPMERATTLAPLLRDLLVKDPADRPAAPDVRRRLAEVAAGTVAEPPAPAPVPSPTLQLEAEPFPPLTVTRTEREAPEPTAPPPVRTPARPARPGVSTGTVVVLAVVLALVVALVLATRNQSPTSPDRNTSTSEVTSSGNQEGQGGQGSQGEQAQDNNAGKGAEKGAEKGKASEDTGSDAVPARWVTYEDPVTGFRVSHPPGWTVQRNGSLTDFRDPASGAYLRVDYTSSPGPSAEQAWRDLETRFAAENPNYKRIRLASTTFKGYPAAVWEFTYTGRGVPLHAVDLGFVTGPYGFALNFQTRADDWGGMQDEFEAFKASFRAPGS